MAKILITGGTGAIGSCLIERLIEMEHQPVVLSRSHGRDSRYQTFIWDPAKGYIDDRAFEEVEHIINLAGNGIADKRWTRKRKAEILKSRTDCTSVLYSYLKKLNIRPRTLIGASAIGYYGMNTGEKIFKETDAPANDFLGSVCKLWEQSYEPYMALGIKISVIRTGIVLSDKGGVYAKMIGPAKLGICANLGNGKHYMPWIHINDLVNIFVQLISGSIPCDTYNAVASQHVNNSEFTRMLAQSVNKTVFLPGVPRFILKLALGELALMLLEGSRVSNEKLLAAGFKFEFEDLQKAFLNLRGSV